MTATALPTSEAARARPHLLAEIERIRALLQVHGGESVDVPVAQPDSGPLDRLVRRLALSPFERDVLVLAAAVELDGGVASLVAALQGGSDPRPTFALAMAALPDAHWDAVVPHRPLRRWALIHTEVATALVTRPLTIDEHVLHAITGLDDPESPGGLRAPTPAAVPLTPTQREVADELSVAVRSAGEPVVVQLDGNDPDARMAVAQRLAEQLDLVVLAVVPEHLADERDLLRVATVLDRESLAHDRLPVVTDARLAALLTMPVVVQLGEEAPPAQRARLTRTVSLPEPREQLGLWHDALPADSPAEVVDAAGEIAQHYRLSARSIRTVAAEWTTMQTDADGLRRLTRERARVSLGILAERIEPRSGWADLVLPDAQLGLLRDLARQARHRAQVYDEWGFARTSTRGYGLTALFAGESGTGKTMAAEVLADDLGLDLFRIDLSAVVSKYIGETEKNLRAVFDAAEASGAVLLFDEADALFGKRSDVKDSHDRYANLEVAYLLQRMETYRGLAILTTNLRSNVDPAFVRRLRFVVQFPFPDEALRERIWARVFPSDTPVEGHDPRALARMQVSGGSIRSIALAAAFAAADAGTPVRAEHVLHAAKIEYAKAERTLTDAEARGIVGPR